MSDAKDSKDARDGLILYVDDEWTNRVVFEQSFIDRFTITAVGSGEAALEVLAAQPVAVVVTDQRMPGMSGNELLEKVRAQYPDTIRIVLTAFSELDPILSAVNDGLVARYVIKPWDKDDLQTMLEWAVEAYRVGRRDSAQQLRLLQTERLVTIGTIAGAILHDLNQPLSYISSSAERWREFMAGIPALQRLLASPAARELSHEERDALSLLAEEYDETTEGFVRSAAIARNLLDGMLRVLRKGPQSTAPPEDPVPAIKYAISACSNLVIRARARLAYEGPASLPPVRVPATELSQVMINLIANATQALGLDERSRGRISVIAVDAGDHVRVEIVDTGPGMSAEVLEKVGTPFYTTRADGTGLGISQCRRILERGGGRLVLTSRPGVGTTATCVLPKG
ncbi:MAG: hybrid sensor histidine kinase/response regulator [Deltaproteobacteria bacterium]|nr:hybrid sensor histidine kinase/response regulator [Deltaproteobacteria bacterium]